MRIAGVAVVASSLLGAGLWATPAPVEAAVGAYVDPTDVRVANWQGWGTSLAWWADRVGTWPAAKRAEISDLLYSPTKGLGLNIVRYNFGGSADPNPIAAMRPGGAVPTFYQKDEVTGVTAYDWTVDKGQRAMLDDAKARGANVFEAQLNSPPYWMTVTGDPRGNRNCGGDNNLASANYDAYVDYIVTVLKKFRDDFGTDFSTISPYNEPDGCWGGGIQEGATFSAAAQSAIITRLDAKLAAEGMPTLISGPESSSLDQFNPIWNALTPAARSAIDQINVHQYGGSNRAGVRSVAKSTGKPLWMSEWGCCDSTGGDSHTSTYPGLRIAQAITTDLDIMRPSAWVMWQAVEDEGIMQSYKITWGAIHADMAGSSNTYATTKMFPFFRQFTNFVRPGSQIIGSGDPNVVASYTPSTGKLNLVAVNSGSTAVSKTFNLSGFSSSSSTASVVRTSASESFAAVAAAPIAGRQLAVSLPAGSVTTYSLDVGSAVASPWNATTEYEIESVKSGQNLSIAGGSVSNGGQGIQSPDTDSAEQRWRLQPDGGFFKIVNVKSGQLLSVSGESVTDGGNVVQWPDGGGLHQRWRIVPAVDGGIAIVNAKSGKLLTVNDGSVASGATVLQWGDTSVTSQRWLIAPK